ncbi:hypothetical protein L6R53_02225 [Myxococcota bacterium]|nr:hypothetical protein [Myxococcota bacterium]
MTARADRLLLALLALGLLGALWLPALQVLPHRFLGIDYVDQHGTQWFYWLADRSLRTGDSPLHSDLFFHPWGKDILAHTGANLLDAYAAVPFRRLLGPVLGYDLFVLAGLLLTGLCSLRLFAQLAPGPDHALARGVGALLVATLPYALFEVMEGRPTQGLLLLPVLFLDGLLRLGRRPGLAAPLLAGALLALCGYQYWYYAFFGGVVALAHGGWLALRPPEGAGGPAAILGRHALVAAAALLLVAPLAWPLYRSLSEVPGLLRVDTWGLAGAAPDVDEQMSVGLFLWQPLRAATGFFLQDKGGAWVFLERTAWTPLALLPAIALALHRWPGAPGRGAWLAMALAAALIATGPAILFADAGLPNLAYMGLVQLVAPLQRLWWPGRAYAFLGLLLALAAVAGLVRARQLAGPWACRALAVVLVAGQGAHLRAGQMLPFPTWDATVPAGYRCLAHGPPGAIIELPWSWTQAHLYYQTVHGRPMLGGMIEDNVLFTPPELSALRQDNALLAWLLASPTSRGALPPEAEAGRAELLDLGYRYVVLQEDALVLESGPRSRLDNAVRSRARELRRSLGDALGPPAWDDARISIYTLDGSGSPCAGRGIQPDTVAVGRGAPGAGALVEWDPEELRIRWLTGEEEEAGAAEGDADLRGRLWGEGTTDTDGGAASP